MRCCFKAFGLQSAQRVKGLTAYLILNIDVDPERSVSLSAFSNQQQKPGVMARERKMNWFRTIQIGNVNISVYDFVLGMLNNSNLLMGCVVQAAKHTFNVMDVILFFYCLFSSTKVILNIFFAILQTKHLISIVSENLLFSRLLGWRKLSTEQREQN